MIQLSATKTATWALAAWIAAAAALPTNQTPMAGAHAQASTLDQRYPGAWSDAPNVGIARALGKNSVNGCGEYYYRAAAGSTSEFLVYCTRNGTTWTSYLVWPLIEKIMGPYPADKTLRPPR